MYIMYYMNTFMYEYFLILLYYYINLILGLSNNI